MVTQVHTDPAESNLAKQRKVSTYSPYISINCHVKKKKKIKRGKKKGKNISPIITELDDCNSRVMDLH